MRYHLKEAMDITNSPILTFDVDWAPDFMIDFVAEELRRRGIRSTWFVTHSSPAIERLRARPELFELGIHPNFLPGSSHGSTVTEVLEHAIRSVPEATAMRSHSLLMSSRILEEVMRRTSVSVDSTPFFPRQPGLQPSEYTVGDRALLRMPIFWEDDFEMLQLNPSWAIEPLLREPGLKIFNFHPIHIFLNSAAMTDYEALKATVQPLSSLEPGAAHRHVNQGRGTRTLFVELLDRIERAGESLRLADVRERWAMAAGRSIEQAVAGSVKAANDQRRLWEYRQMTEDERAELVRQRYDRLDATNIYATSRDFNLRELEIKFIREGASGQDVLDIGCGNGYTLISLARSRAGNLVGLDFSANLIAGARELTRRFASELKTLPKFQMADVRSLPFPDDSFDTVISERLLLNLPSRADQYRTIREVHRVLRPGGVYLMVEGSEDGLRRLNEIRTAVGLEPIPSADADNVSALKFDEEELLGEIRPLFDVEKVQYFGTYYLISRVVHPLLVAPDAPRFDAPINAIARRVAEVLPDTGRIGHYVGYRLIAR